MTVRDQALSLLGELYLSPDEMEELYGGSGMTDLAAIRGQAERAIAERPNLATGDARILIEPETVLALLAATADVGPTHVSTPSVEPRWTPEHVEIGGGYCTGCGGAHIEPQIAPRDDPESPFYIHRDCYDDTGQPMSRERVDPEFTDPSDGGLDVDRLRRACEAVGGVDPEHPGGWDDFAVEVATEYDRLLPTQASDSPEKP